MDIELGSFVWDSDIEQENIRKHGVSFIEASNAFRDPCQRMFTDERHSHIEKRFFCIAKVSDRVVTVRFTYRGHKIRIFGACYWRKGVKYYNEEGS